MNAGNVFEISRFRTDDGPGIRTAVFLKGCPLRCIWCHNPESHRIENQLFYDERQCMGCRGCQEVCPKGCHSFWAGRHEVDFESCDACGNCASVCRFGALRIAGELMTVRQVMDEVRRDLAFYRYSQGGMTLTGGEPLMQPEFALALLKAAHEEGIGSCVETCGFARWETLQDIAAETDIFLYDLKAADSEKHRRISGMGNDRILSNLRRLDRLPGRIIIRLPLVPGCNDSDEDLLGIAEIAAGLKRPEKIEIMPYHPLGIAKCRMLGAEPAFTETGLPGEDRIEHWQKFLQRHVSIPVTRASN